ncbi:MAG: hypothetical protein Q9181_004797 [Wetmoreana brouardii]
MFRDNWRHQTQAQNDSYKLAIGFGAVNAIFSACPYFLIENKEERRTVTETGPEVDDEDRDTDGPFVHENTDWNVSGEILHNTPGETGAEPAGNLKRVSVIEPAVTFQGDPKKLDDSDQTEERSVTSEVDQGPSLEVRRSSAHFSHETASLSNTEVSSSRDKELYETKGSNTLRGRRFLLLISLFGCIWTLLITALLFNIDQDSPARLPLIALFLMIFTLFYSVGAGPIPFLYCAEVFPNEGRGAGLLSLFVPFGINWGHGKLLGLFSGLNGLAFILVSPPIPSSKPPPHLGYSILHLYLPTNLCFTKVWFFVPSTNQTATLEGKRISSPTLAYPATRA